MNRSNQSPLRVVQWAGSDDAGRLHDAFRSGLDDVAGGEAVLQAALTHVLAHPGSMGRGKACLAAHRIVGGQAEAGLHLAVAVEYFHTASLVFDDLPSMDDAFERRHAPCVHHVYGEAAAVLAGLALVNRGYTLLWRGMARSRAVERSRAAAYVDSCLGVAGLLGGQSLDLHNEASTRSTKGVMQVALLKTVPLLRMAVVLPVILSGASGRVVQLLERFCTFRGLAYQIADDLKDLVESSEESGKTTQRDASQQRPNMALLAGLHEARQRVLRLNHLGDQALEALPGGRNRWKALDAMRPAVPAVSAGWDLSMASAAV